MVVGRGKGRVGAGGRRGRESPPGQWWCRAGEFGCCAVGQQLGGSARTWQVHVEQQWHRSGTVSHGSCGGGPQAACFNIPAPIIIIIIPLYQGAADGE